MPMECLVTSHFPDALHAAIARDQIERCVKRGDTSMSEPSRAQESAREARFMSKIVVIIVLASVVGTAIGATIGAIFAFMIGPSGPSDYVIQMVSWPIFMHLLIGMWAG